MQIKLISKLPTGLSFVSDIGRDSSSFYTPRPFAHSFSRKVKRIKSIEFGSSAAGVVGGREKEGGREERGAVLQTNQGRGVSYTLIGCSRAAVMLIVEVVSGRSGEGCSDAYATGTRGVGEYSLWGTEGL